MKRNLVGGLVLAVSTVLAPLAQAQQLIAWPIGVPNPNWTSLLPGMPTIHFPPIRPIHPIHPPRPIPGPRPIDPTQGTPLELSTYKVDGKIENRAATLSFNITFHNPTPQRLEGVLVMPIPADTVLNGFTMTSGGKTMKAELLEASQAEGVYQSIVSQLRDPGILDLVGERMVRARVFPIEPNGDVSVRMDWTQVVHESGGLLSVSVPVKSARFLHGSGGRASVRLEVSSDAPLRTLYSPLPEVKIARDGDRRATVTYEGAAPEPADMSIFYAMRADPLGVGLLAHREEGEDGYFLLSVSPKLSSEGAAVPKDVLFVLDRSGSMGEDGKIEQARKAAAYCLRRLGPKDRFGIVDFATDASSLADRLLPATPENTARALRYVERIEAAGGTNIDAALEEGVRILKSIPGRVPMVFLLTDGLPTVGQTDMNALIRQFAQRNASLRARVFTFGVGSDVNTLFLDKLSEGNRGAHDYILPGETIEAKISTLYQKVGHPALTDVRVEWNGLDVEQVYPRPVPDLFYGSELVLLGRYRSAAKGSLVITGKAGASAMRFEFPVDLAGKEARHEFLPRLWANLKVAHELDAVRLSGNPSPEVVQDIVRLAKRYGIVTPYTSFLITEEGRELVNAHGLAVRRLSAMSMDAAQSGIAGGADRALAAQKASNYFSRAKMLAARAGGAAAPAMAASMASDELEARREIAERGAASVETRRAGDKTFYLRGGTWVDGEVELLEEGRKASDVTVEYLGAEYFELLRRLPALNRYLALGPDVAVLCGGTVYRVVSAGR